MWAQRVHAGAMFVRRLEWGAMLLQTGEPRLRVESLPKKLMKKGPNDLFAHVSIDVRYIRSSLRNQIHFAP